jgi:uncharacterized protein YeaO (DUF488 family)
MKVHTIGGYGHTEESFFSALSLSDIDLFVDVRQRRGMRGGAYAFLNAKRLQEILSERKISYLHFKDLAPTAEVRSLQKLADGETASSKRSREHLSPGFIEAYRSEILSDKNQGEILRRLGGCKNICFFCVEKGHEACHRSVLTDWLEPLTGKAKHI